MVRIIQYFFLQNYIYNLTYKKNSVLNFVTNYRICKENLKGYYSFYFSRSSLNFFKHNKIRKNFTEKPQTFCRRVFRITLLQFLFVYEKGIPAMCKDE